MILDVPLKKYHLLKSTFWCNTFCTCLLAYRLKKWSWSWSMLMSDIPSAGIVHG